MSTCPAESAGLTIDLIIRTMATFLVTLLVISAPSFPHPPRLHNFARGVAVREPPSPLSRSHQRLSTPIMLTEAARRGKRSWEPCDFFELANVEAPLEDIEHGCHCLLYGPTGCGKTTLLFQHALAVARRDADARVLFICKREAIESSPPLLPQASADVEPATRIHMKYLTNDAQVCKLASLMHLLPPAELPSLIILDNFSGFFFGGGVPSSGLAASAAASHHQFPQERREREMSFVRTIAALHECALSIRRHSSSSSSSSERSSRCLLLVSEAAEGDSDLPPMAYLFQKWFACMMAVRAVVDTPATDLDAYNNNNSKYTTSSAPPLPPPRPRPLVTASTSTGKKTFEMKPWRAAGGPASSTYRGGIRYVVNNAGATLAATGFTA